MFKFCTLLLMCLGALHTQYLGMNPMAGAYNNFWDGAVGGQGYWGNMPVRKANVFDSKWNSKDYTQMYNLNAHDAFAGDRFTGFDTMVPYYSPHGASRYTYYPTKSNYLSNNELGAFSYDINEPRYQELYKQYYRFFNKNLDRIQSQLKYQDKSLDLNNDQQRRILNPDSFKYDKYFDGFDENNTLPGANSAYFSHKESGRSLIQNKAQIKSQRDSTRTEHRKNKLSPKKEKEIVHKLEKRIEGMRKLITELEQKPITHRKKPIFRKLAITITNPVLAENVDLKPYIMDSLSPHSIKSEYTRK